MKWRLAIPPRVADAMDRAQKWAIACMREALEDYGYPKRPMDLDRTAVILGNAMAGETPLSHLAARFFPEYARELEESALQRAPRAVRRDITRELHDRMAIAACRKPPKTPCPASWLTASPAGSPTSSISTAPISYGCRLRVGHGGDPRRWKAWWRMNSTWPHRRHRPQHGRAHFVKFCKIGALSATGTRPYAEGADGFVMGEGALIFMMKRLADAERDGDKIYAVLRGMGGSSDGKGKGITAPNPVGQKFCLERAWQNAGCPPKPRPTWKGTAPPPAWATWWKSIA